TGTPDYWSLGLALCLLLNALLTLIAGTRLWAHIFWRAGHEGEQSEVPNQTLRPLTARERWLGLGPAAFLTALVVLAGLAPNPLLAVGRAAALGLLQPQSYIEATGLGGPP
ncbi:MAG: hypothetical protein ACYCZU_07255, partial [Devosia sp.]